MELATGFWAFKTLAAAHEMGLFALLDQTGPLTVAEVAVHFGIDERPAQMLLTGCCSLGLLAGADGGRFGNSPLAGTYLVPGRQYYFGGWVRMLDRRLYDGWGRLGEAIRGNRPTTWDPDRQRDLYDSVAPDLLATFWEAMHALSSSTASHLARALDLSKRASVLDVGGGSGAYAIELCRAYPHLRVTVLELEHVCPIVTNNVRAAGLSDRITCTPGDFMRPDGVPGGHDTILLSMVLHGRDEATDRALLAKCHAALPPGGMLVISEWIIDDDRAGPRSAALMSLNMLIETKAGRNRTAAEYSAWLTDAGFRPPRRVELNAPGANCALVADRP